MSTSPDNSIPAGFRRNSQGHLVPENQIKAIDLLRDELVRKLIDKAKPLRQALADFRADAFAEIEAFVQLSAQEYNAKVGGKKGNVTLMSFDGDYKVIRAIGETLAFDERLQAAKELIDDCLRDWTEGAREEIAVLVQNAFRVDANGEIRTGSVLGLRQLDITDERWKRAMQAIGDAVQVVGSKTYLRLYQRNDLGAFLPISLDLASVDAA